MTAPNATLPIGVLIPTRNCAVMAREHVASMQSWAGVAQEIVVVDSESSDGTVEVLKKGLSHLPVKYLAHPPGLYQSWNFGIQNISAKYVYISTVGDSITREGLSHLCAVAEEFQSDVVVSKCNFVDEQGRPAPNDRWLIDVMLERLRISRPRLLTITEQFLFAVTNSWGAILGSSASNLYRADCLKQRPFPADFGMAGDGAWGFENIFDVKIAVTPERFSTFRQHEKTYSMAAYQVESLAMKFFRLAQNVVARRRSEPAVAAILKTVRWEELEPALDAASSAQDRLEKLRASKAPWVLQPAAWQARMMRSQARQKIDAIIERFLRENLP